MNSAAILFYMVQSLEQDEGRWDGKKEQGHQPMRRTESQKSIIRSR